jgi:hypothetical protein
MRCLGLNGRDWNDQLCHPPKVLGIAASVNSSCAPHGPRSRSRPSLRMRSRWAHRISIRLRSRRDCSNASVPTNNRRCHGHARRCSEGSCVPEYSDSIRLLTCMEYKSACSHPRSTEMFSGFANLRNEVQHLLSGMLRWDDISAPWPGRTVRDCPAPQGRGIDPANRGSSGSRAIEHRSGVEA